MVNSDNERRRLQRDTLVGFLGFFAALAVIQAVINVLRPEPLLWPALVALALVGATATAWRSREK
jgi:hypothetical protein